MSGILPRGIKMINLRIFIQGLKLTWVRRLFK